MLHRDFFCRLRRLGEVPVSRLLLWFLVALAVASPMALYRTRMASYAMRWDDFWIVRDSMSWERTRATLWEPLSLHVCPPFRLLTWILVSRAGQLSSVPETLRLSSIVGLVLMLLTLCQLVSRETDSPLLGVAAVLVGGMTTAYFPAVAIYACSQALWALALTLMTLLCMQYARKEPRLRHCVLSFFIAALAPAWFSAGLIAGPVGSLYGWLSLDRRIAVRKRLWTMASPLLGTAVFSCVAIAVAGEGLFRQVNFGGHPFQLAFRPDIGVYLAARAMTEHLLLWNLSIGGHFSTDQFLVWFSGLVVLCVWWLWRSSYRSLAVVGLVLALAGYVMVYSVRGLDGLNFVRGARWYLLFPHIGWAIFFVAALDPHRQQRGRPVTLAGVTALGILALALFLLHRTQGVYQAQAIHHLGQLNQLRELELIEEVSRDRKISEETVRQAIGPFYVDGGVGFDGLSLIELPPTGDPWDPEEVRWRLRRRVLEFGDPAAFGPPPEKGL